MSEERKLRCPNCNTQYSADAKTCRACGKTLPSAKEVDERDNLHGMPIKDWHEIMGKDAVYFVDLFRKNRDKRFFLSFNPRAMLWRPYWFLSKKMYKGAFLCICLTLIMTAFFTIIGVLTQLPRVSEAVEAYRPYTQYKNFDGSITQEYPAYSEFMPNEIDHAYRQLKTEIYKGVTISMIIGILGGFMTNIFLMLSADWFYREHILNKTVRKKGYAVTPELKASSISSVAAIAIVGEFLLVALGGLFAASILFLLLAMK